MACMGILLMSCGLRAAGGFEIAFVGLKSERPSRDSYGTGWRHCAKERERESESKRRLNYDSADVLYIHILICAASARTSMITDLLGRSADHFTSTIRSSLRTTWTNDGKVKKEGRSYRAHGKSNCSLT